jgi:hypothetical protein
VVGDVVLEGAMVDDVVEDANDDEPHKIPQAQGSVPIRVAAPRGRRRRRQRCKRGDRRGRRMMLKSMQSSHHKRGVHRVARPKNASGTKPRTAVVNTRHTR